MPPLAVRQPVHSSGCYEKGKRLWGTRGSLSASMGLDSPGSQSLPLPGPALTETRTKITRNTVWSVSLIIVRVVGSVRRDCLSGKVPSLPFLTHSPFVRLPLPCQGFLILVRSLLIFRLVNSAIQVVWVVQQPEASTVQYAPSEISRWKMGNDIYSLEAGVKEQMRRVETW